MQVPNWEVFPTELQGPLIQTYPGIAWRAALDASDGAAQKPAGVVVRARRRGAEVAVRVSRTLIAHEYLSELLQDIYEEAETWLSGGTRP